MFKYLLVILTISGLAACVGSDQEKPETGNVDAVGFADTVVSILPSGIDSFEIVYYKKPFTDSIRYSRFFRVTITNDSTIVNEMNRTLRGSYLKHAAVKKCLSEGKLIVPFGGDIYRTIYFSRLETGCPYLYYIKDGEFYYHEITPLLNEKLNELEKLAVEPR